ncbi:MAG: S8/S53 family peptidase [Proteobacteria bacterium]|nr:S8/S53 family peptidase [Pseudomonadota bacterium]
MNHYYNSILKFFIVVNFFYYGIANAQMWSLDYQSKYQISIETKSRSSSIPNDPLLFPNDILPYHQYHLNIQANGFSIDYPATWQYARGHALLGIIDVDIYALHPDLAGNYRSHLSSPFILTEEPSTIDGVYYDHGSWVLGVLAPTNNNNEGLTGVCQNCSVVADFINSDDSYLNLISQGVQAINMSYGGGESNCTTNPNLCLIFENEMVERDIVMVGISQNRHTWVNIPLYGDTFPGSHPNVIQVGGLDESLQFWNNCEPGFVGTAPCGSLATQYQELVAPAKNILTAITYTVNENGACGEVNNPPGLNYDICSGNSFAAPQVTGLVGIIRSIYPQLSAPNIRLLLQKTAQSPHAERHDEWGYGLINPLAVVTEVLGTVAGVQQTNRSIPFFVVRNLNNRTNDTAFSSSPQFIAAALSGDFRNLNDYWDYQPLNVGLALNNYQIPSSELLPYAAFHILGTHNNPLHPGRELTKLYRLSKLYDSNGANIIMDHAYVTAPYIEQFNTAGYEIDTIEGYIFPACDTTDNSCQQPAHSECLIARNTNTETPDWAIMLQSQLTHEAFQNHTIKLNATTDDICLGYAYQPIDSDSDGLIDGYEAFLGTDINQADSDSDGRSDGAEMLEPIEAKFSDPLSNASQFAMNAGLTGAWYYPETSGQGLLLDVMQAPEDEAGQMFVAWFTYDLVPSENDAEFGSINHRWFTAQGTYTDDKADLSIYLSDNGRFDNPQSVSTVAVGDMQIRFTSCTEGIASYSFAETNISGTFPITRISPDTFCTDTESTLAKSTTKSSKNLQSQGGLSGAWYNPDTSGQGLLFDVMEARDEVFVAWFSYSLAGDSSAVDFGSGDHRWFTAQGSWSDSGSNMTVYLSEGGIFDQSSIVTNKAVGTLQVIFDTCTSGSVNYQFDDLDLSGNFPITRITPNVFCQEASDN